MGTALEVTGLRAAYSRIPILHGIDLSVAEGEFVGVETRRPSANIVDRQDVLRVGSLLHECHSLMLG